mgnify:FL=1
MCFELTHCTVHVRLFDVFRPLSISDATTLCLGTTAGDIMSQLIRCLESNMNSAGPTIIVGDWNCPNIDWELMMPPSEQCQKLLYDFVVFNGMRQFVHEPTRKDNILDLVLTDDDMSISNITVSPPFGNSDQNTVNIELLCSVTSRDAVSDSDIRNGDRKMFFVEARKLPTNVRISNVI